MPYNKEALPVRMREVLKKEVGGDVALITKQNYRYDISKPVNPDGESPDVQLIDFSEKVMQVLGEMSESFASMQQQVLDDTLTLRVRAVGYEPSAITAGSKPSTDDAIQSWIDSTTAKATTFFGEEVSHNVASILANANEARKEREANALIVNTFAKQFSPTVANRMAELLKQVLQEEAAKGIAPEDSAVLDKELASNLEQDTNSTPSGEGDEVSSTDGEANTTPNGTEPKSKRNRSRQVVEA